MSLKKLPILEELERTITTKEGDESKTVVEEQVPPRFTEE